MEKLLYVFFIAFINNIDNISVRIAYSLKGIRIDINKNLLISIITFIVSTLAALLGNSILTSISPKICNIFTMIILVLIGLYFIFDPYIKRKPTNTFAGIILNPDNADIDNSKNIELKEAIFLGVALNINNIGGSFSAGVLGSNIYLVGVLSALISFVVLWLGNYLYLFIKNPALNKRISIVSGLSLIALGIKQLL